MDGAAGWGLLGDPAEVLLLAATGVETVGEALHDSDACTVHRCRLLQHPLSGPVALKRIKISNNAAFERFERERAVLQRAQHPCVVRPLYIIEDAPCYGLVLPLAERGSLSQMLHRERSAPLPQHLVLCFSYDMACALDYVHTQLGMLHRDIKPANTVVQQSGRAVLIDFDRACAHGEAPGHTRRKGPSGGRHKDYMVGTLVYMAPELMRREHWSAASDVYSLAIALNELHTGCVPYSDVRTTTEQLHTVLEANYNEMSLTSAICSQELRPNVASRLLPPCQAQLPQMAACERLIMSAWSNTPAARPSAHEVKVALQEVAAGSQVNLNHLLLRQTLLQEYDTHTHARTHTHLQEHDGSCALGRLGGLEARHCASGVNPGDCSSIRNQNTGAVALPCSKPGMSEAAALCRRTHAAVIEAQYDERTTVHAPPAFSPRCGRMFVWGGGAASCGRRGQDCMEDAHFVYHALDLWGKGVLVDMFGVFDGHGGTGAAAHCRDTLPWELVAAMLQHPHDFELALTTAFNALEESWSLWAHAAADNSGCTALVSLIVHNDAFTALDRDPPLPGHGGGGDGASRGGGGGRKCRMYVANAGDCRCVVSRRGVARAISTDHTAAHEAEAARVRAAGGEVLAARDGSLRVGGVIEVTRSIGDRLLKPLGLSAVPEIDRLDLEEGVDDFVVLASDGLWGCLKNQEVVDKVACTVKHVDFGPNRLVADAYEAGSDDNITALVIYLNPPAL